MTQTKVCSKCGVEKEVGGFSPLKNAKDGFRWNCRECERAKNKAWREANQEKVRAKNKAWREANREKARAKSKAWREANPEEHRAKNKAWREANPEKARAKSKAWAEANPEKVRARVKAWAEANPDKVRAKNKAGRDELRDSYVKHKLGVSTAPSELIELKREQLKMHRLTKQFNQLLKEKNNGTE